MSNGKGLDSLKVWQKGIALSKRIHKELIPQLPKEEKWAMVNQFRRASQSVPANIAEGYGRYYYQEGVRFSYIARGSLEECYSFLVLARDLNYIEIILFDSLLKDIEELRRLLAGYINYLKRSKRGQNEPGAKRLREDFADYEIFIGEDPDPSVTE